MGSSKLETSTPSYPSGTWIWIPDDKLVWRKAEVVDVLDSNGGDAGGGLKIKFEDSEEFNVLPHNTPTHLCNTDIYSNNGLTGLDDLAQLTHLHEAAVLHSLHLRFEVDNIYTFTGSILIAVNPFKPIAKLYDLPTIQSFLNSAVADAEGSRTKPAPHVFAVGASAYHNLCSSKTSQTILISGESGAGKTESTKFVMKLLALAGSDDWEHRSPIENKVLQSNPLLESLGNAKTLRNHNSSRFGKFIEMQFTLSPKAGQESYAGKLAGACIRTYLLESVRVCQQMDGERNYHIFYQLCAAAASAKGTYVFPSLITLAHVNDVEEFEYTVLAMQTIGISFEDQMNLFNTIGAVLSLGNILFEPLDGDTESSNICSASREWFSIAASFLSVSEQVLENALTTRTIKACGEEYRKPLRSNEAEEARDALAKALYGTLFLQLVKETNGSIGYRTDEDLFCGVLDIFGFECFQYNSFEQLCINYTNERLQQFFNTFVFKCEEALYTKEGIGWSVLDFPDNQDCVDLMEHKTNGIFSMLDEECMVPRGSDQGFGNKLKDKHKNSLRFGIIKVKSDWFIVHHFAGPVGYCVAGFVEKNRDQLSLDIQSSILSSSNAFVQNLFQEFLVRGNVASATTTDGDSAKPVPLTKKRPVSVSSEFRHQLNFLMTSVAETESHFIRCIKPSPKNVPDEFNRPTVTEQLRYGGVLQAVQVSRAGYPVRSSHQEAYLDYLYLSERQFRITHLNSLAHPKQDSAASATGAVVMAVQEYKRAVSALLDHLDVQFRFPKPTHSPTAWAVGETLVFFKQETYSILSDARAKQRIAMATLIRRRWIGLLQRRYFLHLKASTIVIQTFVRQYQARQRMRALREERATCCLQRGARRFLARLSYQCLRATVIALQAAWRCRKARQAIIEDRRNAMATRIQNAWRTRQARRYFIALCIGAITAQRRWRLVLAKRQLKRLRQEQREATALIAQKKKLEEENSALKSQIDDTCREMANLARERDLLAAKLAALTTAGHGSEDEKTQRTSSQINMTVSASGKEGVDDGLAGEPPLGNHSPSVATASPYSVSDVTSSPYSNTQFVSEESQFAETAAEDYIAAPLPQRVPNFQVYRQPVLTITGGSGTHDDTNVVVPTKTENGETNAVSPLMKARILEMEETIRNLEKGIEEQKREAQKGETTGVLTTMSDADLHLHRLQLHGSNWLMGHHISVENEIGSLEPHLSNDLLTDWSNSSQFVVIIYDPTVRVSVTEASRYASCVPNPSSKLAFCRNSIRKTASKDAGNDVVVWAANTKAPIIETANLSTVFFKLRPPLVPLTNQTASIETKTKASQGLSSELTEGGVFNGPLSFDVPKTFSQLMKTVNSYLGLLSHEKSPYSQAESEVLFPSLTEPLSSLNSHHLRKESSHHGKCYQVRSGYLKRVAEIPDLPATVTCLAFSSEQNQQSLNFKTPYSLLAAGCRDGAILLYRVYQSSLETFYLEDTFRRSCRSSTSASPPGGADLRPQSGQQQDVTSSDDKEQQRVELHQRLLGHQQGVTNIFFSYDGLYLISTSSDGCVRFWDIKTGQIHKNFKDKHGCLAAAFLPLFPSRFIVSNSDSMVRVVETKTGCVEQRLRMETEVNAITFDESGLHCFAGSSRGTIHVLDVEIQGLLRCQFSTSIAKSGITSMTYVGSSVLRNTSIPCLLVNSLDSCVTIVDCLYGAPDTGGALKALTIRHRINISQTVCPLRSCYSSAGAGWLISASEDSNVYVIPMGPDSNYNPSALQHHKFPVVAVAVNQSNTVLASGDTHGTIVLWRWVCYNGDTGHNNPVTTVVKTQQHDGGLGILTQG